MQWREVTLQWESPCFVLPQEWLVESTSDLLRQMAALCVNHFLNQAVFGHFFRSLGYS